MKISDMPEGPASKWEREVPHRFLVNLMDLEEAAGQFVQVAVPDLIDAGQTGAADVYHDRIAGVIEQLKTALTALWFAAAR